LEARVFATIVEHDHGQVLLPLSLLAKTQQIFMRGGGQWLRGHDRWKVIAKIVALRKIIKG
jgi:hypothetical protein